MKVLLAGYNVDSAVLDELKRGSPSREDVTPETEKVGEGKRSD